MEGKQRPKMLLTGTCQNIGICGFSLAEIFCVKLSAIQHFPVSHHDLCTGFAPKNAGQHTGNILGHVIQIGVSLFFQQLWAEDVFDNDRWDRHFLQIDIS